MRPLLRLIPCVLLYCLSLATPSAGQEVGLSFLSAGSDHREFPSSTGFAASVLVELGPEWLLHLSFNRFADVTDKEGGVCLSYSPRIGCSFQEVHSKMALSGLRGGMERTFRVGDRVRLSAGGGLSFNHVDGRARGISGLRADLLIPNGGQIGAFGTVSAALAPYPAVPARIVGRFNPHWVNFNACSGEDPPQYDPFCEPTTFWEVELGVSYAF